MDAKETTSGEKSDGYLDDSVSARGISGGAAIAEVGNSADSLDQILPEPFVGGDGSGHESKPLGLSV